MHLVTRMALVLGLSISLTACGVPSQPSTDTVTEKQSKAFRAELQPLCRDSQSFQREADLEFPRAPLDLAVGGERMRKLIELEATNDDAYAELKPPAHLAAAYSNFMTNREAIAKQRDAIAAAMESGSLDAAKAEDAKFGKLNEQRIAATATLGACQLDLTKAGRAKVVAQLTEFATSKNPAKVCGEIVAAPALPQLYKGSDPAAECRSAIEKDAAKGALPDGIKVFQVDGWDKLMATADYSEKHGSKLTKIAQAKLYYVDGAWRVFSVS